MKKKREEPKYIFISGFLYRLTKRRKRELQKIKEWIDEYYQKQKEQEE